MATEILIGSANQLQFGSYVQVQLQTNVDGVTVRDEYVSFDANKLAVAYDTEDPNIVVFHFNSHTENVSNADYSEYSFGGVTQASAVALAQTVIADIAQYTT